MAATLSTAASTFNDTVEGNLSRARAAIDVGQWKNAFRAVKRAAELDGQDGEVVALQAWIIYHLPSPDDDRKRRVCLERLELAVSISPNLVDAHLYLARVAEEAEAFATAHRAFRNALKLKPGDGEARAGAERMEKMHQPDPAESGVLSRVKGWLDK